MPELLIIVGVLGLLLLVWCIATYNRFVRLKFHIRESWADIDVELKRRYDLIPNLLETVKGYAKHEREVLEQVTKLRNRAAQSTGAAVDQAVDESALMIGMKQLFAVVEGYPELQADAHFLALQKELSLTEDRIAASRRFYNGNVREMKNLREMFPSSIVGRTFGFEPGTFFELESEAERVVPKVEV